MSQITGETFHSKGRREYRNAPIIVIGGDKGGVGKSFLSRVVTGWLLKQGETVHGFDADSRNPHLQRFYQSAAESTSTITIDRAMLRSVDGWAAMYAQWEATEATTLIVIDLPGNIGDMLDGEVARLPRVATAYKRSIIILWAASEEEDSVWLFQRVLTLATAERTLFVMNGRFGETADKFELWQNSKTRAGFLANGGRETLLPVLPIHPRSKIARARSPFNDVGPGVLNIAEWIDFEIWWEQVEIALEPFATMLQVS